MSRYPTFPIANYRLEAGSALDRARLVKFMQRAYREMGCADAGEHLAETVERHFSAKSQLWWLTNQPPNAVPAGLPGVARPEALGCLWLGEGIDQRSGLRQAYVFLLYVSPAHRRRGLGRALMLRAQQWAKAQGYRQIGLQVFEDNTAALSLYHKLGYTAQARWLSLEI